MEEKKTVDDLFINFDNKDNRRKTNNVDVFAGKRVQKDAYHYTIGPSFLEDYVTIIRTCNKPVTEEQFRLLCLSCYSGNLNTVRIILAHVKKRRCNEFVNTSRYLRGKAERDLEFQTTGNCMQTRICRNCKGTDKI